MTVWDTLQSILSSIGGVGVLVALAIWFIQNATQYWQDKRKLRITHTHENDMAITSTQLERKTHIYYKLAEAEFDALQNVWNAIFDFAVAVSEMIPIMDQIPVEIKEKRAEYIKRFEKYATAYNVYVNILNKCKPVISKSIYATCDRILIAGRRCGAAFEVYYCCQEHQLDEFIRAFWEIEKANHEYRNNEKSLYDVRDELGEAIRLRYEELCEI